MHATAAPVLPTHVVARHRSPAAAAWASAPPLPLLLPLLLLLLLLPLLVPSPLPLCALSRLFLTRTHTSLHMSHESNMLLPSASNGAGLRAPRCSSSSSSSSSSSCGASQMGRLACLQQQQRPARLHRRAGRLLATRAVKESEAALDSQEAVQLIADVSKEVDATISATMASNLQAAATPAEPSTSDPLRQRVVASIGRVSKGLLERETEVSSGGSPGSQGTHLLSAGDACASGACVVLP